MGGLICCCWRMFCCECSICDKPDDWKIEAEIRPGERGAGWLYKRAKSSAIWSKRYFVLTDTKLLYFLERDRLALKGEIILAGATASISTTRADTRKKFYFIVSHPKCGFREFYAKTRSRREQWLSYINMIANRLQNQHIYGKLLKQGGLSKTIWQERFCVCAGESIDYFDSPTENQCKGSIVIAVATISSVKVKDKFCFEVTALGNVSTNSKNKKANKKYVFAAENEFERDKWVEVIKRCAVAAANNPSPHSLAGNEDEDNPLHAGALHNNGSSGISNVEDGLSGDVSLKDLARMSTISDLSTAANELSGYLMKKSPNMMKGWQKRYFQIQSNGDIKYFKSETDSNNPDAEEKGIIRVVDFVPDNPVELREVSFEIILKLQTKKIQLKASSLEEATAWSEAIQMWIQNAAK